MRSWPYTPARLRAPALLGLLLACGAAGGRAQAAAPRVPVRGEVFVNSEEEAYLRLLQVRGVVAPYPWSVRPFSPAQVDRLAPPDSGHPWAGRYDLARGAQPATHGLVRPRVQVVLNSAFPYGRNDGPVWAGKGLTTAVEGGFWLRRGRVWLTVDPMLFVAQNAEFALEPNGQEGRLAFADALAPGNVDQPQRFGEGRYWRLDPGQSTLRVSLGPVDVGASTANQHWGPAVSLPLVLGSNAPGIAHAFAGTARPLSVGIGTVHAQWTSGFEGQSAYSPARGDTARRLMSGLAAVFVPRGIPGLELGGSRFFHYAAPRVSAGEILSPFESLLKVGLPTSSSSDGSRADNQLASAFFRWVLPRSGFEFYGELAKEDHNYNLRDLLQEPDHNAAYALGLARVWARGPRHWVSLRGELLNAQISHLDISREQTRFYVHGPEVQGHTNFGQVLGSPAAFAGAGSVLTLDSYGRRGRTSLTWYRVVRDREFAGPDSDVTHALELEGVRFLRRAELTARAGAVYEIHRGFADDAFNLNLALGVRMGLP
jgi:hypothetical protein